MELRVRHTPCETSWRSCWPDRWPALGLAGALMLLASCGFSQTPGNTSDSGTASSGHVTVVTSKSHFGATETVLVTIANGLASSILAADHQSDCTVLAIEYWTGQTWQLQNPCLLRSPTRLVPFGAGTSTLQQLRPPSGPNASGWLTGAYRIAFAYRHAPGDEETTIYSAQFTIS